MEKILKIEEKIDLKGLELQGTCQPGDPCRYDPYLGKYNCMADCSNCTTPYKSKQY